MQLVHFYLNFPGTTREALKQYEAIFGTKILAMQTFGETPFAGPVDEADKGKIMNAQLPITETIHLMASDSLPGHGPALSVGNNFHITLVADDKAEADRVFAGLSAGGSVGMPLANAPWGPYFGMCTDRFGIQWIISLSHPA